MWELRSSHAIHMFWPVCSPATLRLTPIFILNLPSADYLISDIEHLNKKLAPISPRQSPTISSCKKKAKRNRQNDHFVINVRANTFRIGYPGVQRMSATENNILRTLRCWSCCTQLVEFFPRSMGGGARSMDGDPIHGFSLYMDLSTCRVQHNQDSSSVDFMLFSSPRPPFQYYWPTPPVDFSPYAWIFFSATRRVTGSTSDRNYPWMGSPFMDICCTPSVDHRDLWMEGYSMDHWWDSSRPCICPIAGRFTNGGYW